MSNNSITCCATTPAVFDGGHAADTSLLRDGTERFNTNLKNWKFAASKRINRTVRFLFHIPSSTMIILDEHSPLKTEGEVPSESATLPATAPPPPYVSPLHPNPSYQAVPYSHHVIAPRRQLRIRRLHVIFTTCLLVVLLLCGAFIYGFYRTPIFSFQR